MWFRGFWPTLMWNEDYWAESTVTPPAGEGETSLVGLGHPKSFSTAPELGGGSW